MPIVTNLCKWPSCNRDAQEQGDLCWPCENTIQHFYGEVINRLRSGEAPGQTPHLAILLDVIEGG